MPNSPQGQIRRVDMMSNAMNVTCIAAGINDNIRYAPQNCHKGSVSCVRAQKRPLNTAAHSKALIRAVQSGWLETEGIK